MKNKIQVRRTGGTWGVYVEGKLHEGGFFSRLMAQGCADDLRAETVINIKDLGICEHGYAFGCKACNPDA
jgi:hypothetical protein